MSANPTVVAPNLFRAEICAVIRRSVYQGRLQADDGLDLLIQSLNFPIKLYDDNALLVRAYQIAQRFSRPRAYDTQYIALAERLSCDFWTVDERLYNRVQRDMPFVKWLGLY